MTEAEKGLLGLGSRLVSNLPAQFLVICLVNVIFLGAVVWMIDRAAEYRQRMIEPIIAACVHPQAGQP